MKRIIALLMVFTIVSTGCGNKSEASSGSSDAVSVSGSDSSAVTSADSTGAPSLPIHELPKTPASAPTEKWEDGYLPQFAPAEAGTPIVTLHTSMGDVKIMLFPQAAPLTVENFVTHCEEGYYNNTIFHRVIKDFMIQGGDPKGTGTGGESIWGADFADEPNDNLYNFRGALSMAKTQDAASNSSQFFIVQGNTAGFTAENFPAVMQNMLFTHVSTVANNALVLYAKAAIRTEDEIMAYATSLDQKANERLQKGITEADIARLTPALNKYLEVGGSPNLDFNHTVFGQVIEGMDIVDAIAAVKVDGEGSKPVKDVIIQSTEVAKA